MPHLKNQHYVPKFYLRNFSRDPQRRSVSLLNLASQKYVPVASVRDQCAEDYFYDRTGRGEAAFGGIEGAMAAKFRELLKAPSFSLRPLDKFLYCFFIGLQDARTARAEKEFFELTAGVESYKTEFAKRVGVTPKPEKLPTRQEALLRIAVVARAFLMLLDLTFVVVRNESGHEFITSDHPVVRRNNFILPNGRPALRGFANSGLIIFLPINPETMLLAFDPNIYSASSSGGVVVTSDAKFVRSANLAVAADAMVNVFASPSVKADELRSLYTDIHGVRETPKWTFVEMRQSKSKGLYVRADDPRVDAEAKGSLLSFTENAQRTELRPPFLRRKHATAYYFDDGTAACPLRDRAWFGIAEDFVEQFRARGASLVDIFEYAPKHPAFGQVRRWKHQLFA